ncbi:FecR family protein [Pseudomonas caspiana]|uniref:FecR family protein n=1 Tax=Pseudomonas caspiana TaxID=1451454 RepID=UPI0032EBE876
MDIALDWLLRLQQSPENTALQAEVSEWEQATPENAQAMRKAQRLWRLTGQLPASTAQNWPPVAPAASPALAVTPARPSRRRPRRHYLAVGIAACLLVALAPRLWLQIEADYQSPAGERSTVKLADGSQIILDSNSALAVDFTGPERQVRLLAGQAYFDVAPDASKPFHVKAGDVDVRVTGTAFNVDLEDKLIDVAVSHGSVQVTDKSSGQSLSQPLTAGQRLTYDRELHEARLQSQPVSQISPWRNGQLIANNARLGDVVAQLRRYLPGMIMLSDNGLASKRVTGVYDIDQPEAALSALAKAHGATVSYRTPWVRIVSK